MKKVVTQSKISTLLWLSVLFLLCCVKKEGMKSADTVFIDSLSINQLDTLLKEWKRDSLGCLNLRISRVEAVKKGIDQMKLVGSASDLVIEHLGSPNRVHIQENGKKSFIYFMECVEEGKGSLSNMYCHFEDDTLKYYSTPLF